MHLYLPSMNLHGLHHSDKVRLGAFSLTGVRLGAFVLLAHVESLNVMIHSCVSVYHYLCLTLSSGSFRGLPRSMDVRFRKVQPFLYLGRTNS